MTNFDWDGSNEKDSLQAAYEKDTEDLWSLVDFWSDRLTKAIDRLEASRRRLNIFAVVGAFGIASGAFVAALTDAPNLTENGTSNFGAINLIIVISSGVFAGAVMILVFMNEIQNLKSQRREVVDTFFVFKELQQIFVSTADRYPSELRHRNFADTRGRVMMMNYLERKAERYLGGAPKRSSSYFEKN